MSIAEIPARIAEAIDPILAEIPNRLGITKIMRDAHRRLVEAAGPVGENPADKAVAEAAINNALFSVLREIAACGVGEYERRTGEAFFWHDEPDPEPDLVIALKLDANNNVVLDNG